MPLLSNGIAHYGDKTARRSAWKPAKEVDIDKARRAQPIVDEMRATWRNSAM